MDVHDFQKKAGKRVVELEKIVGVNESRILICPNVECGKLLSKILVLTDLSKKPRETYYACPHCLSKVDIVEPSRPSRGKEETLPLECPYYFGFLKILPKDASIPDECLTCSKIIQCKKK